MGTGGRDRSAEPRSYGYALRSSLSITLQEHCLCLRIHGTISRTLIGDVSSTESFSQVMDAQKNLKLRFTIAPDTDAHPRAFHGFWRYCRGRRSSIHKWKESTQNLEREGRHTPIVVMETHDQSDYSPPSTNHIRHAVKSGFRNGHSMPVGARNCRRRRGVELVRDLKSWTFPEHRPKSCASDGLSKDDLGRLSGFHS
jgi:hypothetical protein